MKSTIIISSTETIEGMKIEKYIDLISTNVVLGTNVFSDLGASFSDIFGGTSEIYQNKLEKIYKIGLDKLKRKAQNLSANGIVGIKIDFDEIGGKGKSMFMLSVTGMAVRIKAINDQKKLETSSSSNNILPDDLDIQIRKMKLSIDVDNQIPPTQDEWDFLLENPIEKIELGLLKIYLNQFKDNLTPFNETQRLLKNYFLLYISISDEDSVSKILYSKINENPDAVSNLIKESKTFSPLRTLELLENNDLKNGISTLDSDKRLYQNDDLKIMKSIISLIEGLPNTGKIEFVKNILGSSKEKFICENGHQNDIIYEFCYHESCKKNIKGLTFSEVKKFEEFKFKTEALELLMN